MCACVLRSKRSQIPGGWTARHGGALMAQRTELSARDDDPYAGRGLLHSNSGVAGSVGQVT